ncbi:non-homologous end joining protein Ku [Nitrosospira briensis]|uniref:non-homologous end joining protein Ku n=1 Tax=Nitrosospira briensis TaxID=35799 RepID=UPI0008E3D127|nr:Ku protein [Nitrosospira briensis]SFN66126.1 DNA end-binding protein Ku [Nitrosospira briensis]
MATSTSSSRSLWKGAISFGLVHIPVALHSATSEQGLNFDWLDKRSMDPVGYKRINKKTGKEIDKENIVKGIEYEDGQYVVLSQEEISAAYPKTTQTIEIEMFVPATDIPFVYLERPYYVVPINKGGKVYALLREALLKTRRVGIARVVIQTKQHLAVLVPSGPALVLNLLRWGDEIRSWEKLSFPPEGTEEAGITEKELKMAEQLVMDMSGKWNPEEFRDSFKEEIMKLVLEKVETGDIQTVAQPEEAETGRSSAQILDLTELLQRSLKKSGDKEDNEKPSGRKSVKAGADTESPHTRGAHKRRAV